MWHFIKKVYVNFVIEFKHVYVYFEKHVFVDKFVLDKCARIP